jgi:hypothetical protein
LFWSSAHDPSIAAELPSELVLVLWDAGYESRGMRSINECFEEGRKRRNRPSIENHCPRRLSPLLMMEEVSGEIVA